MSFSVQFFHRTTAVQWSKTLYAAQHDLWSDYLRAKLRHPRIPAFTGT